MPDAPRPGPPNGEAGALTGAILDGRYQVGQLIGRGGMAEVYLGHHLALGRPCAIKVMHPGHAADPGAQARFEREAAAASRVDHPHVCRTWDFGRTADGLHYLVLEFLEGESLATRLEAGVLPMDEALAVTRQCAAGLQAAHAAGVVHRDLKPGNVVITRRDGQETAVLVDFGLARPVQGAELTRDEMMVGTPEVMSPEQIAGDPVGPASDQYQLALLLVRMVTGVLPFAGATAQERMLARLAAPPLRLGEINPRIAAPPGVEAAIRRALARDPRDRFPTVSEFAACLGGAPLPPQDAPTEVLARPTTSRLAPARRLAGLVLGGGVVIAAALLLWPGPDPGTGGEGATTPDSQAVAAVPPALPPAGPPAPAPAPAPPPDSPGTAPTPLLPDAEQVFSDDPAERVGARERAERVYRSGTAPDTLRAEAAFMVAETYRREGAVASARLWLQRCLDLQERPGCRRLLSQLP